MSGYLLFKSLHLIAVISWMAGLLYLPRIFVYHVENFEKEQATEIFETMERKLYNYIMRPAMILSWLFGIILIWINGIETFAYLWLQLKILLVVVLTIYHEKGPFFAKPFLHCDKNINDAFEIFSLSIST